MRLFHLICPRCGHDLSVTGDPIASDDVEGIRSMLGVVICACDWRGTDWRAADSIGHWEGSLWVVDRAPGSGPVKGPGKPS